MKGKKILQTRSEELIEYIENVFGVFAETHVFRTEEVVEWPCAVKVVKVDGVNYYEERDGLIFQTRVFHKTTDSEVKEYVDNNYPDCHNYWWKLVEAITPYAEITVVYEKRILGFELFYEEIGQLVGYGFRISSSKQTDQYTILEGAV